MFGLQRSSERDEHGFGIGGRRIQDEELFRCKQAWNVEVSERNEKGDDDGESDSGCERRAVSAQATKTRPSSNSPRVSETAIIMAKKSHWIPINLAMEDLRTPCRG